MFKNKQSSQKNLAVFFGGITVEHEVSVITAQQMMKSADTTKYNLIPVYIDKSGFWWTGEKLFEASFFKTTDLFKPKGLTPFKLSLNKGENDIDVALLCFHGAYGEAGNVQGLLELAGIPHQGPDVTSAALCFDKIHVRQVLEAENIPQPSYIWFTNQDWQRDQQSVIEKTTTLEFPVFVKPANGGSTIGIQKVTESAKLPNAIETVLAYDSRVIIETGITDCIEVNVSVLGTPGDTQASVAEQPIKQDEFLSYVDKYERGGGKKSGMASATRRIPAPISQKLMTKLQEQAQKVFSVLGCSGVVRIDFFANPSTEEVFVIEPNTIPGSMSFYLWEATDMPYSKLIDELVDTAEKIKTEKEKRITSFESNILKKNN